MAKALTITITGDVSKFTQATDKAGRDVTVLEGKVEKSSKSMGSSLKSFATIGVAALGGIAVAGFAQAGKAASDLEQAVGGTTAVFKDQADQIGAFAKGAADAVGLSETAARTLTSQIGGALKGYGFSVDDAAGKSKELVTLGADLAATFGGTTEDAVIALSAALRGETDPLERYAIALNQNMVNAKAVEMGLATSTSTVDQHAKAQATLALITERSADAQGQFGRESDTAAGAAARASANWENSLAKLGEVALPIMTEISTWLSQTLPGAVDTAKAKWDEIGGKIQEWSVTWGQWKADFDRGMVDVQRGAEVVGGWIDGIENAAQVIWDLTVNVGSFIGTMTERVEEMVQVAWDVVKNVAEPVGAFFGTMLERIEEMAQVAWDVIQNVGTAIKDWVLDPIIGTIQDIMGKFQQLAGMAGIAIDMPETQRSGASMISGFLADGGPAVGGRSYIVGEAGPEVFTPQQSGTVTPNHALGRAAGGTLVVPVSIDGREIARAMVDLDHAYSNSAGW